MRLNGMDSDEKGLDEDTNKLMPQADESDVLADSRVTRQSMKLSPNSLTSPEFRRLEPCPLRKRQLRSVGMDDTKEAALSGEDESEMLRFLQLCGSMSMTDAPTSQPSKSPTLSTTRPSLRPTPSPQVQRTAAPTTIGTVLDFVVSNPDLSTLEQALIQTGLADFFSAKYHDYYRCASSSSSSVNNGNECYHCHYCYHCAASRCDYCAASCHDYCAASRGDYCAASCHDYCSTFTSVSAYGRT
jgi:hypothetical protein